MICVSLQVLHAKAKTMPIGYLEDCRAHATVSDDQYCFTAKDFKKLVAKYRRYSVSDSDPYRERISGCCDRADQY